MKNEHAIYPRYHLPQEYQPEVFLAVVENIIHFSENDKQYLGPMLVYMAIKALIDDMYRTKHKDFNPELIEYAQLSVIPSPEIDELERRRDKYFEKIRIKQGIILPNDLLLTADILVNEVVLEKLRPLQPIYQQSA